MTERLRPRDLALLATESPSTPMHNATVEIFEPGDSGFDYARLVELIADRIAFVPRYRQRLQTVPGRLANARVGRRPGLRDRATTYAAPRSRVPVTTTSCASWSPGSPRARSTVAGRCGRSTSSRASRGAGSRSSPRATRSSSTVARPWTSDRCCSTPPPRPRTWATTSGSPAADRPRWRSRWERSPTPSSARDRGPDRARQRRVRGPDGERRPPTRSVTSPVRWPVASPVHGSPDQPAALAAAPVPHHPHRSSTIYKQIRSVHGGTINDVILATITGALRGWLMTRTESMAGVPHDPRDRADVGDRRRPRGDLARHPDRRPPGQPADQRGRRRSSASTRSATASRPTRRPVARCRRRRLAGIAGFAPTTFHALGSRVAAAEARRGFHLSVTNVPGPQFPLYAAGAEMVETYPVHPLLPEHTLAVGVTSYNGGVFYGITADRDAVPDVDTLGQCLLEALDELAETPARRASGRPAAAARGPAHVSVRAYLPDHARPAGPVPRRGRGAGRRRPDHRRGRLGGGGVRRADDRRRRVRRAPRRSRTPGRAGRRRAGRGGRPCPCGSWASVHVDTDDDADPDDDLAWYATQEIPDLLAGR